MPEKLGVDIQQSSQGFSLSKSQGGRTLFTIRAANAVQYTNGGRAELRDVNIVVYGRQSNRFDQIYGSNFEYDPKAGTIMARGEVNIDLQGNASGPVQPDQAPPRELQNPIHLKTSGLLFNQKTGIAHTDQLVEFRVPQGNGSAVGATYDTKSNVLTLQSQVELKANDQHGTTVKAAHGTINKEPRAINLTDARIHQQDHDFQSDRLELLLNPDNEVQKAMATGNVDLHGPRLQRHSRALSLCGDDARRKKPGANGRFQRRGAHGHHWCYCRYHDRRPRDGRSSRSRTVPSSYMPAEGVRIEQQSSPEARSSRRLRSQRRRQTCISAMGA